MFALFAFVGCFLVVDEDTFPDQYASLSCERTRECSRGYFEAEWDGVMDDCVDDVLDNFDDVPSGCDFDDDEARDCLETVQAATCGELYEDYPKDCAQVYSCSLGDFF